MLQPWNKIIVMVTIIHLLALRFIWVGLAVPYPPKEATFNFMSNVSSLQADPLINNQPVFNNEGYFPKQGERIDQTPWKILLQQP